MNAHTHNAALRAAAKVAFSMTLLGCGGTVKDDLATANATDPNKETPEQSSESSISGSGSSPTKPTNPTKPAPTSTGTSTTIKDAGPPKKNCDTVLTSAFADAGWIDPNTVSPDVKDCCIAELKDGMAKQNPDAGWVSANELGPHGFLCCEATNWGQDTNDQRISMACTPWGPPVPPTMHGLEQLRARWQRQQQRQQQEQAQERLVA